MGATAVITVQATASGFNEGGIEQVDFSVTNTSAVGTVQILDLTTAQQTAPPVTFPSSAKCIIVVPDVTSNLNTWAISRSTAESGVAVAGGGFMVFRPLATLTTYYFYSNSGTTHKLRMIVY